MGGTGRATAGTKAQLYDALAAGGKAPAGGKRLEPLDLTTASAHLQTLGQAGDAYLGEGGAAQLGREELRARVAAGDVVVLDVRPVEEYRAGHIPGARSIPVDELADRISEFPEETEILVYCRGEYRVLAHDAVRLLTDRGRRAIRLDDGTLDWSLAELPVDAGYLG